MGLEGEMTIDEGTGRVAWAIAGFPIFVVGGEGMDGRGA